MADVVTAATPARRFAASSTPDRLRLMAIVTVLVIVAAGAVSWFLTDRLVSETTEVASSTGEVLIATQQVSASFAEADAAAVSVHLAGADGNREQRRLYELATDRATSSLERVARLVGDDEPSHTALQAIVADTTDYAGLVETARLSSIQDLPGADNVLAQATSLNRDQISPQVEVIAARAADRFDDQTSSAWYAVAIILLLVALAVLVVAQLLLARRFHRLINVPLLLASLVVAVLVSFAIRGFATQQQAFADADSQAFEAIQVSEQIQQTAYLHRALGTAAVLDGAATDALAELEQVMGDGGRGLLQRSEFVASSARESATAREIVARWQRYVDESAAAQQALAAGNVAGAELITQGSANSAFNGFNTTVEAALLDNREQFLGQLDKASDALQWMRGLILFGSIIAAVCAWWGFAQRIGEYR